MKRLLHWLLFIPYFRVARVGVLWSVVHYDRFAPFLDKQSAIKAAKEFRQGFANPSDYSWMKLP